MNEWNYSVLKWLQAWRTPEIEEFFLNVTKGGEGFWILAAAGVLFWVWGARIAYRVGFALIAGDLLTGVLKSTCCMPRPWVRDPAILPVPRALGKAIGYSFPSGHAMNSAVLWGGVGAAVRRWWIWVPALAWIALVGLSRLVLGVHTPLDVAGAWLLAVPVVWALGRVYDWTEHHPAQAWRVLAGALLAAGVAWAFVKFKPMPPDAAPGFFQDAFRSVWAMLGVFGGWFIERRYIRYEPAKLGGYRMLAVAVGVPMLWLIIRNLGRLLAPWLGATGASYAVAAANPLWIFVVWPFLLKGLEKPPPR